MTFPFVGTHTDDDWEAWGGQNFAVEDGAATIAPAGRHRYAGATWVVAEPPLPFDVVDLDVDDCGDLWLLAADGSLWRHDLDTGDRRRLNCTWDRPPAEPRAIAVTSDTVYVAAGDPDGRSTPGVSGDGPPAADPAGDAADSPPGDGAAVPTVPTSGGWVRAFSKHRMQTRWLAREYVDPVALARHGDTVSVLDRGDDAPRLAVLGRDGRPRLVATGFRAPFDLAVDAAGDRYVLDEAAGGGDPTIERVPAGEMTVDTAVASSEFETTGGAAVTPAAVAAGQPGEILVGVADAVPSEHSLFRYRQPTGDFERLTTYAGPVTNLLLRRDDIADPGLYVVGDGGSALSFLPATLPYRINPDTGLYDGQVVTRLDAGEPGMEWHRVTTTIETPPETQVRVYYHATDDESLQFQEPGTDPVTPLTDVTGIGPIIAGRLRDAYVRGLRELVQLSPGRLAELAGTDSYPVSATRAAGWMSDARSRIAGESRPGDLDWQSVGPPNPEDALLSEAVGRYLWVKVELVGTATAAPRVESLRAYFPRQSYLRYLPAIYRTDADSTEFLERFLSLFESVFTDVEEEIEAATRYLDPEGVPAEALDWLAGWLALAPDDTWSTVAKRRLVRDAHELFKARGTREGLRRLLALYLADRATRPAAWQWAVDRQRETIDALEAAGDLDAEAADRRRARLDRTLFVWEPSDLDCIDDPAVREIYERLLPCPQCFAVLLWPSLSEATVREAQRLVETTRPAHAVGRAVRLEPSIRLAGADRDRGHHTYLGVNSALADREFELESSGLGTDTRLSAHEEAGQLGVRNRLGTDTDLT